MCRILKRMMLTAALLLLGHGVATPEPILTLDLQPQVTEAPVGQPVLVDVWMLGIQRQAGDTASNMGGGSASTLDIPVLHRLRLTSANGAC